MNTKKILSFAVGPLLNALISLAILPLLTWVYTPEVIGRLAMLNVAASLVILVFSLGLDQAFVREYHESKNRESLFKLVFLPGGLLLLFTLAILLIFDTSVLSRFVIGLKGNDLSYYIAIYIFCIFSIRFFALILRMTERGIAFSISQALPKFLILLGIACIVIYDKKGTGIELLFQLYSASIVITLSLLIWVTRKHGVYSFKNSIEWNKLRELLNFGLPLVFGGAAFWGLTAMDKVFLRNLSSFEELGLYSVAVSFAGAAIIVQSVFSTIWAPTVYKWASENENLDKIEKITDLMLGIVVFIFCMAGLFSWLVMYILPEEYKQVPYLLVTCMVYPLLYTLSECTAVGIGIMKRTRLAMFAVLIALLVNLLGNYYLVPILGASGAATSTAISFFILLVLRTELSILVWRPIKRMKIYIFSFCYGGCAILFSLFGEYFDGLFIVVWYILMVIFIYAWRKYIFLRCVTLTLL